MLMTVRQALEVLARHRGDRVVVTTMTSGGVWPSISDVGLEFAYLDVRKRVADGFREDVEINRFKKAASKPRGKLAHGHDLHAGLAAAGGVYPNHVTGEDRMDDHRSAHLHLPTKCPRLWCALA